MLFDLEPYLPFNKFLILYAIAFPLLAAWVTRRIRDK